MASNTVNFLQAGLACCGVEAAAVEIVESAGAIISKNGQSNILVVAGTVTKALAPKVLAAYETLIEPRVVIAFGVCSITGGPYWDSYSVLPGAGSLIPIDINVPGCPPSPEDLAKAIDQAKQMVIQNA